jgi:hypothetical protein
MAFHLDTNMSSETALARTVRVPVKSSGTAAKGRTVKTARVGIEKQASISSLFSLTFGRLWTRLPSLMMPPK